MVMGLGYKRPAIVDYLCMTAGTCLMGIAIQSIYDPVGMVVGGFTVMVYEPGVESSGFFMRMEKKGKEIFVAGIIWNGNAVFLASGTASLEYSPG